jgi:hypothetical protein
MSGAITEAKPKKRKKPGLRAAKRAARDQGVVWALLSKAEKSNRRLLARAEKGSTKAAAKLLKRLGITPPAATATAATSGADSTLLKSVLPDPDPTAAQGALQAIKKALGQPQTWTDGFRR